MQKTKRKGYAMIYVLCIMILLSALLTSILALEVSNRVTTSSLEKNNKARLLAQTAMEKAVAKFKMVLATDFSKFIDRDQTDANKDYYQVIWSSINSDLHKPSLSTDNYTYEFGFTKYTEAISGLSLKCLTIKAQGSYGGITKTITAYIDEDDISNIYFDKMFGQPISEDSKIPEISNKNLAISNTPSVSSKDSYKVDKDSSNQNLYMVTLKSKGSKDNDSSSTDITLKSLTDDMYKYICEDHYYDIFSKINIDNSNTELQKISAYIDSLSKDPNGNTYVQNMLRYSSFYKVLLIDGDLDVTAMDVPLINYVIYCTGTINVQPGSNLKLWNSNLYAKNIISRSAPITATNPVASSDPKVKYRINKNNNQVEFLDDSNNVITGPFEITGISQGTINQQAQILKYILGYNSDPNNPYSDFIDNKGGNTSNMFTTDAVGQFTSNERDTSDTYFYANIDGYAYGLKLRYVYWNEN